MSLLSIRDLRVEYTTARGTVAAIPDFSLEIGKGESFGLVGESGCGKSTLIMAIMGYMGRNGRIARGRSCSRAPTSRGRAAKSFGEFAAAASPSSTRNRRRR